MNDFELTPPLPVPTPTSQSFWDGLAEGRVMLQRCGACGSWVFYPRERCSHCLADALAWHEVSGAARLYTWTLCERPPSPHFNAWGPFLLAVVELEEGVRMTSNLVDADAATLKAGMALAPVFVREDGATLLRYRPA